MASKQTAPLAESSSKACAMTKLAILRWWILFNCSSTRRLTCIVMFVRCQFAEDVALTGGSQPRQLARRKLVQPHDDAHGRIDVTPCGRSILHEEGPVRCWATGQLCETAWAHFIARLLYSTLQSAQQRKFSWFSCGGRPNIRPRHVVCPSCSTPPIASLPESSHRSRPSIHSQRALNPSHHFVPCSPPARAGYLVKEVFDRWRKTEHVTVQSRNGYHGPRVVAPAGSAHM